MIVPWRTLMCISVPNEKVLYKFGINYTAKKVYKRVQIIKKSGKKQTIPNLMDVFRQENVYHGEGLHTVLPVTGPKGKY